MRRLQSARATLAVPLTRVACVGCPQGVPHRLKIHGESAAGNASESFRALSQ